MGHESKRTRRKRLRAARDERNKGKLSRRGTRGIDSGAFSETGLVGTDVKPSLGRRIQLEAQAAFQEPKKAAVREQIRRSKGIFPGKFDFPLAIIQQTPVAGLGGGFRGSRFALRSTAAAKPRFSPALKRAAVVAGSAIGGAVVQEGISRGIDAVRSSPLHRGTGQSMATLPAVGGQLPPGNVVVKTWNTGTAQFARLLDGRIAVQRKDGTIKTYRPQKHIVIPRNPRVGTLIRADKRMKRLVKGLKKVVK